MALRMVLVILAVALGFELPSRSELGRWSDVGRDWVKARGDDLDHLCHRAEHAWASVAEVETSTATTGPASTSGQPTTSADLIFEAVSEGMAIDLAADLASLRTRALQTSTPSTDPEPEPECVVIKDGEEPATTIEGPTALPKPDRVASAITLTRQAARAWASLLQETIEEAEVSR